MRAQHPGFNDYEVPSSNFDRARIELATPFHYIDIKLDTAGVNFIVPIAGNFLYIDAATTGSATIELNNQYSDNEAPFTINPGFALKATFTKLRMNWAAQPGKIIRIMYSTDDSVVPSNTGISLSTINNGLTNPAAFYESGYSYGAGYKGNSLLGVNTPDTIVAPAANLNGIILWNAEAYAAATGASVQMSFLAKAAAPANNVDGDVLALVGFYSGSSGNSCKLSRPVRIAAGKGLYYIEGGAAATISARHAEYTLL